MASDSAGYSAGADAPAAPSQDKAAPTSLGALFANKAKKKPKANNLNAARPKEPEQPKKPSALAVAASTDEGWERAMKRDEELLQACGLHIKEVESDGACLFRAFSDQMTGDGGAGHAAYREQCVDFLQANRSDFEPFLEEDFSQYCSRMRKPAEWGSQLEVQALARALGVNALIYQPAEAAKPDKLVSTAVEMTTAGDDARCVQLSFHPTHHAGSHYNSVRCSREDDAVPASTSLPELRRRIEEALKPPEPAKASEGASDAKAPAKKGGILAGKTGW